MKCLIWLIPALIFLFGSCVPNRKVVFLQNEDLKEREDIPRDSVLRNHEMVIKEYRIQPLDILSINFETLSNESDAFDFLSKLSPRMQGGGAQANNIALTGIFVNTAGEIEYAVLGKIKVSGLTIFEAQDKIQEIASRFVPDVVVRVRMLNFRFTILGEVNGEKTVLSSNPRLTMMEALGMAGGLTDLADRSLVKVIRQNDYSSQVFYVDLLDENFIESEYYYVQQNDVIIVPPLKQRTFRKYWSSNISIVVSTLSFVFLIITLTR